MLSLQPIKVSVDSPLLTSMAETRAPLLQYDLDLLPRFQQVPEDQRRWFANLGAEVYVPVYAQDRLLGILALGAKRSGDPYTSVDVALLRTSGRADGSRARECPAGRRSQAAQRRDHRAQPRADQNQRAPGDSGSNQVGLYQHLFARAQDALDPDQRLCGHSPGGQPRTDGCPGGGPTDGRWDRPRGEATARRGGRDARCLVDRGAGVCRPPMSRLTQVCHRAGHRQPGSCAARAKTDRDDGRAGRPAAHHGRQHPLASGPAQHFAQRSQVYAGRWSTFACRPG